MEAWTADEKAEEEETYCIGSLVDGSKTSPPNLLQPSKAPY